MTAWIRCSERLPELDLTKPSYAIPVHVLVCTEQAGNRSVREMVYTANPDARTEKARTPRWEETRGCLAWSQPVYWMPLPEAPSL